jgi:hypothetical protein
LLFTGTKRPLGDAGIACRVTHRRAHGCFANRFCIGSIVLLALHEGFDVGRRDQPNVMAQLADLSSPKMSTATGFHRDDTRGQLAEKVQHLRPPQLFAQNRSTSAIGSMGLKHILCQPIGDCYAFACQPTDRARP